MNQRQQAIFDHWSNGTVSHTDPYQTKLRAKIKQAVSTVDRCVQFFEKIGDSNHQDSGIEDLRAIFGTLDQVLIDFSLAQARFDKTIADVVSISNEPNDPEQRAAIIEIFGLRPKLQDVLDLANDLWIFANSGVEEFAHSKGFEHGCLLGGFGLDALQTLIIDQNSNAIAEIVAENRILFRSPGRLVVDRISQNQWYAGWDDFLAWRKERASGSQPIP